MDAAPLGAKGVFRTGAEFVLGFTAAPAAEPAEAGGVTAVGGAPGLFVLIGHILFKSTPLAHLWNASKAVPVMYANVGNYSNGNR